MLKRIPAETRKKLSAKGYFPQDGYLLQYLPVPPNCLSVPEISDGVSVMSLVSQIISKSYNFHSFDGDCIHLFYPRSLAAKQKFWSYFLWINSCLALTVATSTCN